MNEQGACAESPRAKTEADRRAPIVDLTGIDLGGVVADRAEIDRLNPHRHEMALLDKVVWMSEDMTSAVGLHQVRDDAFWVRGHFPNRATMPGVIMIEAGAQLTCYLWNFRQPVPRVAAFLRIDDAVFRRAVVPGETLILLCREQKMGRRRFVTDIQGLVEDQIAFTAKISGMAMEEHQG